MARSVTWGFLAGAFMACGFAPADPPQTLAPFFESGVLKTGRLEWVRGRFPDATPEQQRVWRDATHWAAECVETRQAEARAELSTLGVNPIALPLNGYGAESCDFVRAVDTAAGQIDSWADFQNAVAEALPVFEGFRFATEAAEDTVESFPDTPALMFISMSVGEQVLRKGLGYSIEGSHPPQLSDAARGVFNLLVWREAARRDLDNTASLKAYVDQNGWPTIEQVGRQGSGSAWLIVQHADQDPAFQLRALRLMDALVATQQVNAQNHAYLYDRVMLKITGKQRYGTQFTCIDGRRRPQPLEDDASVEQSRQSANLGTLAEYTAMMEQRFGVQCQ